MRRSSDDLPAFGKPTSAASASSFSRSSSHSSSPGSPVSAKRGACRVGVAKRLLPAAGRAAARDDDARTGMREVGEQPPLVVEDLRPDGTRSSASSPEAPCFSAPRPLPPRPALMRWFGRNAERSRRSGSATQHDVAARDRRRRRPARPSARASRGGTRGRRRRPAPPARGCGRGRGTSADYDATPSTDLSFASGVPAPPGTGDPRYSQQPKESRCRFLPRRLRRCGRRSHCWRPQPLSRVPTPSSGRTSSPGPGRGPVHDLECRVESHAQPVLHRRRKPGVVVTMTSCKQRRRSSCSGRVGSLGSGQSLRARPGQIVWTVTTVPGKPAKPKLAPEARGADEQRAKLCVRTSMYDKLHEEDGQASTTPIPL